MVATDKDIASVRREIQKLLEPINRRLDVHTDDIDSLTNAVADAVAVGSYAEIVNILSNSHPEWSKDAYTMLGIEPDTAGDGNLESYGWFRQLAADTALAATSANALKAEKTIEPADHTLWAANEAVDADIPRWHKVDGVVEAGGVTELWDLIIQMPNDIVVPGQRFYVQLEALLAGSTALPANLQLYAGVWDNTVGQQKWIEGGTFTITDDQGNDPGVPFGIPGDGTTPAEYQILATTDSGEQAISNILAFPNAPAVFSALNHPRVRFSGVAGFIKFEIYRKIGSVYVRQYTVANTIEGTYYDIGNPPQAIVDGWPTAPLTKPRAYAVTSTFAPGSITGLGWQRHELTVFVPTTYDRSQTDAGNQFFRMGLTDNTTDARQILFRHLGLSMGSGRWSRSPDDTRPGVHSRPSSTMTESGASGGGGVGPPPGDGGGGGACVLLDSMLTLDTGRLKALQEVDRGEFAYSGGTVAGCVRYVRQGHTTRIFRVRTAKGHSVGCTFDHPFITGPHDFMGTPCEVLKRRFDAGEPVHVITGTYNCLGPDLIESITEELGDFWVGMPIMDGPHTVVLNRFLCHNEKPIG